MSETAIGGYFGQSSDVGTGLCGFDSAFRYQSARSAITAILRTSATRRVWLPFYICSAVTDAVVASGAEAVQYRLSANWSVPPDIEILPDDWILCVDYFGLCAEQIFEALQRFGTHRVLVDASQSLFYRPSSNETVVYSPRKFVGVPDGGLAITPLELPSARPAAEQKSVERSTHLLSRAAGQIEEGYKQFLVAEASLHGCDAVAMSAYTSRLLASIDAERVASRRVENYQLLARELVARGFDVPKLPAGTVPLCCPLTHAKAPPWRKKLAEQKIYTPTYWPDTHIPNDDAVALGLRDATLFLPCDQRYDKAHMHHIIEAVIQLEKAG